MITKGTDGFVHPSQNNKQVSVYHIVFVVRVLGNNNNSLKYVPARFLMCVPDVSDDLLYVPDVSLCVLYVPDVSLYVFDSLCVLCVPDVSAYVPMSLCLFWCPDVCTDEPMCPMYVCSDTCIPMSGVYIDV